MADQLLVSTVAHGHHPLQEVQESLTMTALAEVEVYTLHREVDCDTASDCSMRSETVCQVEQYMVCDMS